MKIDRHGVEYSLREAEIILIVGILLFCFIIISGVESSTFDEKYAPNVITGLATIAGILTAFVGFWSGYMYTIFKNEQDKKFMYSRISTLLKALFTGLMCVILGLSLMVYNLRFTYALSLFGTFLIIIVSIDVLLILDFSRIEPPMV